MSAVFTAAALVTVGLALPTAAHATAPSAPTNVTAGLGPNQATVKWNSSDGGFTGSPVASDAWLYSINVYSGGSLVTTGSRFFADEGPTQSSVVTGLTNGTSYTFKVIGWNGNYGGPYNASAESAASNEATPAPAPSAPTGVTAGLGPNQATVTWNSSGGGFAGSPVATDAWLYSINVYSGGSLVTTGSRFYAAAGATQSSVVTGLTNGTSYTFKVIGWNGNYGGPYNAGTESSASNAITPAPVPSAPTGVTAGLGPNQATVTWNSSGGGFTGSPVATDTWLYSINVYSGGTLVSTGSRFYANAGPTQSSVVTGLTNGTSYTFKVIGWNGSYGGPYNAGAESSASNAVTPAPAPSAPTGVAATAGNTTATVTWNSSGGGFAGSPVATDTWLYSIDVYSGGTLVSTGSRFYANAGPTQSSVVTGLTNGTSYTFKVIGWNGSYGGPYNAGTASSASNAVTPHL